MRSRSVLIYLSSVLIVLLIGCQGNEAGNSNYADVEATELTAHENFVQNEDLLIGLPVGLKYDEETRHVFIHDFSTGVIETDDSKRVLNVFGRKGPGPGETGGVDDFFIRGDHFYNVEVGKYFINKYSLKDGEHISTFNYEDFAPEKVQPKLPFTDINNIPFITLNETILLPSQAGGQYLYQIINWEGEKLADIGEIPEGHTPEEDMEETRLALENKHVPARDSVLAFPVNDHSNPDEIFIVYSAIPKIAKYNLSGQKLWERDIPHTPEVDSLMIDLSEVVKDNPNRSGLLIPVRKYVTGKSTAEGDLFLVTNSTPQLSTELNRPVWVHQFDPEGQLVHRYKMVSDEDLSHFIGFDFDGRKLFSVVHMGIDIRTYEF